MAQARTYLIQDLLLGRWYAHAIRGDGYIAQADRKDNADTWVDGQHLAAFAIRVRPFGSGIVEDYWQTIRINMEIDQ